MGLIVIIRQDDLMIDKAAEVSQNVTLGLSGGVTIYGVYFQSIESFIGATVMISTFLVMWYYSHKRTRILERQADRDDK